MRSVLQNSGNRTTTSTRHRVLAAAAIAAAVAGPILAAAPAHAALNYDCTWKQTCLYYNSSGNGWGAFKRFTTSAPNFTGMTFQAGNNGSAGAGQTVKNNAAAAHVNYNFDSVVYYNSGYDCSVTCQNLPAGSNLNLNSAMKNENASLFTNS